MFKNRFEAATKLADQLKTYRNSDAVVVAIPKGGMEIGCVLSNQLNLPLDVMLIKKIGHPANKELAIGAVSLLGRTIQSNTNVSFEYIEKETKRIQSELQEQHRKYYEVVKQKELENKTIILTDDGVATGFTMEVAIDLLRKSKVHKIIIAVPVAPKATLQKVSSLSDEVICLEASADFNSVGQFFGVFKQAGEMEALSYFRKANKEHIET